MSNRFLILLLFVLLISSCSAPGIAKQTDHSDDPKPVAVVDPGTLRSFTSDDQVGRFYAARQWQLAWSGGQGVEFAGLLQASDRHAINSVGWLQEIRSATGEMVDVTLTRIALEYAQILAHGRIDPTTLWTIFTLPRNKIDVISGLSRALEQDQLSAWFNGLPPQDPEYAALSDAYVEIQNHKISAPRPIQGGPPIRQGDSDARLQEIVEALQRIGYLDQSFAAGELDRYTAAVAAAVRAIQQENGIAVDGIIGADTLDLLNRGPHDRLRKLAVNLERRRWLERNPPPTRIDVNTAAAFLTYWRDGTRADRRRVVVGQPGWETPQLSSPIYRLVANPTWTVPKSIERAEIAPQGEGYLDRNNMVRRDRWIVQLPGPENALGQVKFDMQNDYAIYLHDTPAKHLFERQERHFSHGCIRVQDAIGFAHDLAEQDGSYEEFGSALASGERTFVNLKQNIPVRMMHNTIFLDPDRGELIYRTDVYGWDDKVSKALGLDPRGRPRVHGNTMEAEDGGP